VSIIARKRARCGDSMGVARNCALRIFVGSPFAA